MTPAECLAALQKAGVKVAIDGTLLRFKAPAGSDLPTLQRMVAPHRDSILEMLLARAANDRTVHCQRHGSDHRAWCEYCGPAFPDDLPLDAVDHRTGRIKTSC